MDAILQIKQLSVTFPGKEDTLAVRSVNLNLNKGELLALVGESGSGKTVLCKTMLNILGEKAVIPEGEILLEGQNLLELSDKKMGNIRGRGISMVFQDPYLSLNPTISIGKQIMETVLLHEKISKKDAKIRTLELLKLVDIPQYEKRFAQYPHHFSGGMRQRVAIAIALACRPKILLADEPTTALDQVTQVQIIDLLKKIQNTTDISIIFITHDLSLVENIADNVAVMYQGEIVECGSVDDIFYHTSHEYTKKLLGYRNYGKGISHTHGKIHFHKGVPHTHLVTTEAITSHTHIHVEPDIHGIETTTKKLIEIKHLKKYFPLDHHTISKVLDDVTLDIYTGEILGLVGPSGCGKSTLARCIVELYKPTEGTIQYNGDSTKKYRRQMIFQDSASAFNPRMTLEDIIGEPLKIQKLCKNKRELKEKVYDLMRQVELDPNLAPRHPYDVSGGQRQRAAIARALSVDPEFIVADEPISSLDISIQAQIMHLFKKIQKNRNLTILLIAHDLPMVMHISDRIIELNHP